MEAVEQSLKSLIDQIYPLADEEWVRFRSVWQPFYAKRKELITRSGDQERHLYFVVEGVQRVFYTDENHEATIVFTYPPSFGGVLDSMLLGTESKYSYEALTSSKLLKASFADVKRLMAEFPSVNELITKGTSLALSGVLERMTELQCYSSEEKIKKLLSRSPHILKHVPHKYLANYLGIDPTNFSKLMNRVIF